MKTTITLNKNTLNKSQQEAVSEKDQDNTPHDNPFSQSADQPVIQVRQSKLNKQHQCYSEQDHATVAFTDWPGDAPAMQMAEEDRYDPDLAVNLAGNRGYTLQPG